MNKIFVFSNHQPTIKIQETLHLEVNAKAPELRLRLGLRGTKCCMLYSYNSSSTAHLPDQPHRSQRTCVHQESVAMLNLKAKVNFCLANALSNRMQRWLVGGRRLLLIFFLLLLVEMFSFVFDE